MVPGETPLPDDFPLPQEMPDFAPWEQRIAPGAGSGPRGESPAPDVPPSDPVCARINTVELGEAIADQADLAHYGVPAHYQPPTGSADLTLGENAELWAHFRSEQLYDTRRLTLEQVHLFEWFPLSPGRYHTPEAASSRSIAFRQLQRTPDGRAYFTPGGKASMVAGGIGAVRLRPRILHGEPHYFMTVSSNGVCHEGFPVLIPRRFYAQIKPRLLTDGAVPVTLSGEMRYISGEIPDFFGQKRTLPRLLLHVDTLEVLPAPRRGVSRFLVSAAVSFIGAVDGQRGAYLTYATFDPASRDSLADAVAWLRDFYVGERYPGQIVTDFDEVVPRFPEAVFGLADVMTGRLQAERVGDFLQAQGLAPQSTQPYFVIYNQTVRQIHTGGGAYVEGSIYTEGGDFTGRDRRG